MTYYIPNTDAVVSDETIYKDIEANKAFNKYIRTLEKLGTINVHNEELLCLYVLVRELEDFYTTSTLITDEIRDFIEDMKYCIKTKSCLFK